MPRGVYPRKPGLKRNRGHRPIEERFSEKVKILPDGCWQWIGRIDKAGYGRLRGIGRSSPVLYAHRFAYEQRYGPIPEGAEIDHLCRRRWCCNPEHLEAVPHRVNVIRGEAPLIKVHISGKCARGHEVNEQNAYFRKDRPTRWNCNVCRRERRAARKRS